MGVLTRIDGQALIRYCALWSRWVKAEQFIAKHGESYPLRDNENRVKCLQQFPQVAIAHRLSIALTKIENEFGMTPSGRSRIEVDPAWLSQGDAADSDKARLFRFA
jgi:P27 family predicted phage terminase small subunit